jgi:hypothetical protein
MKVVYEPADSPSRVEIVLSNEKMKFGRETFTAGDTRISRHFCNLSLQNGRVQMECLRDGLRLKTSELAPFVALKAGELRLLDANACVEFLRDSPMVFRLEPIKETSGVVFEAPTLVQQASEALDRSSGASAGSVASLSGSSSSKTSQLPSLSGSKSGWVKVNKPRRTPGPESPSETLARSAKASEADEAMPSAEKKAKIEPQIERHVCSPLETRVKFYVVIELSCCCYYWYYNF